MESEPESCYTAATLCLKGSSCGLFSLKGSGQCVLRNRLYRSVLTENGKKLDKVTNGGKTDREKKINPMGFFFSKLY